MKIKELIEYLEKFDLEMEVFVDGYEGGFTELKVPIVRKMILNYYDTEEEWWFGPHEELSDYHTAKDKQVVEAVLLER